MTNSKFLKKRNRVDKDDRYLVSIDKLTYVLGPPFAAIDIHESKIV